MIAQVINGVAILIGALIGNKVRGGVPVDKSLHFAYDPATVAESCTLTDDPARTGTAIATLKAGTQVTYLTRFYNRSAWDYVEVKVGGDVARGFVRAGSLNISHSADPLEAITH